MTNRWTVLAVLFLVRTTMAFQFQAAAALSPIVMDRFAVGLADIGLLIGLYLSPGIVIAIPGGAIGKRFGDARVVAAGMVLMVVGGLAMALSPVWEVQLAGRLVAGIGGVVLNVLMSKMVTDWFAGRDLAAAMAVFVNSWPIGIAIALLVLPVVAGAAGLPTAMGLVTLLVALGLILLVTAYTSPEETDAGPLAAGGLSRAALRGVFLAGSVWGLYNAALGMVFGFGPAMLVERGWTVTAAASTTSVVLWAVAVSTPVGGILARTPNRRDAVIAFSLATFAVMMVVAARTDAVLLAFIALGLAAGLAPGPIMSLPADFLTPQNRALGLGVYFTLFYLAIFVGPIAAGRLAEVFGTAAAAFWLGAALLAACAATLAACRTARRRFTAPDPA